MMRQWAMIPPAFADRSAAGRALAELLRQRPRDLGRTVVLALPRGGVPVGVELANALAAPLDVLVVRKIGAPANPELAVAALAEGEPPVLVVDPSVCAQVGCDAAWIDDGACVARAEITRRIEVYRAGRPLTPITGAAVVLVDDGAATGLTMRAALKAVRQARPAHVTVALPVASESALLMLRSECDDLRCVLVPTPFSAVGLHYRTFDQLSDQSVRDQLASARASLASDGAPATDLSLPLY